MLYDVGVPRTVADLTDVIPIREAFEASGLSKSELARRMGWFNTKKRRYYYTSKSGVRRRYSPSSGEVRTHRVPRGNRVNEILYRQSRVHYAVAVRMCRAMDLDPVDVGL